MFRVLIVEDNEMNRDMLARRLEHRGFEVSTADDGQKGLTSARTTIPDLILLDMSLPEVDGWEVVRKLKADPTTRNIPVIALTAHAMQGDREAALKAGCEDYDTKPVDMDRLLGKMTSLFAGKSQNDAAELGKALGPRGKLLPGESKR